MIYFRCTLNLTTIFETQKETYVYEIVMLNGEEFIDIPIAISNLKSDSNQYPNKDKLGPENLSFVRRFIITDAVTGIVGAAECPNPSSSSSSNVDTDP